jgi:hypothetical protein
VEGVAPFALRPADRASLAVEEPMAAAGFAAFRVLLLIFVAKSPPKSGCRVAKERTPPVQFPRAVDF